MGLEKNVWRLNANKFLESHMIEVYFTFIISLLSPEISYAYLSCIKNDCIFIHVLFSIKYATKLGKYKTIKFFFLFLIFYYNFMGTVWHPSSPFDSSISDTKIPLYIIASETYTLPVKRPLFQISTIMSIT